jgi:ferric-dicitrate binding protein FerR (iron transport regulator)
VSPRPPWHDEAPYAAQAAELLRLARPELPVPLPQPGERAQGIAAVQEALRQRARRRRLRTAGAAVLAGTSAAALLVFVSLRDPARPVAPPPAHVQAEPPAPGIAIGTVGDSTAEIVRGSERRPARTGAPVEVGESLITSGGALEATLASGAHLALRAGALALVQSGPHERLFLSSGSIQLSVPKLGSQRRLVVATADAEIEVHGTQFMVSTAPADERCAERTTTRLVVTEGLVAVRHAGVETFVPAGKEWPTCTPVTLAATHERRPARPRPAMGPAPALERPAASSTLAEENDLFAAAVAARRRGALSESLRRLDELLRRFPHGPLAGDAWAERRKLLDRDQVVAPDR